MEYPPYYKAIKRKYRYTAKANPKLTESKDKCWAILSDYTRMRDFCRYGTCVSCGGRVNHWRDLQGGHYVDAGVGGAGLSFDEKNVNGQCEKCNMNKRGGMYIGGGYKTELNKRWGDGTAEALTARRHHTDAVREDWFINRIEDIYAKFIQLVDEHPDGDFPSYISSNNL